MSQDSSNQIASLTSGHKEAFNTKIDSLINEVHGNKDLSDAGSAAKAGVAELYNGSMMVRSGDVLGGTAAILKGIGGVSALLVLIPGVGAIAAAVMAMIMGFIASILEALKPATRSLEDKIQGMITDESLRIVRDQVSGAYNTWITTQAELTLRAQLREDAVAALKKHDSGNDSNKLDALVLEEQTRLAKGMSWESLTQYTEWRQIQQTIFTSFSVLASRQGKHSKEWMPLYQLTVQLALNFWIGFIGMAALVDASGAPIHAVARKNVAEQLRDQLYGIHFASLNEGALWAILYSPRGGKKFSEARCDAYRLTQHNHLIQYRGVFDEGKVAHQDDLTGQVKSIAVSSKGTIFSVGYVDYTYVLCSGRGAVNTHTEAVPRVECEQVFIGEKPDGTIKVLALHGDGTRLTVIDYDDRTERHYEDTPTKWTAHSARWGEQTLYQMKIPKQSDIKCLLSLAIDPGSLRDGKQLAFYAFKLDSKNQGMCCKYTLGERVDEKGNNRKASYVAKFEEFKNTFTAHDTLTTNMMGVDPAKENVFPCTVSCTSDVIYAQAGNLCWVDDRTNTEPWAKWDLRKEFWDTELDFHQAYGCEDGALICMTNKGLQMRYWNSKIRMSQATESRTSKPEQIGWVYAREVYPSEETIETTRFFRETSPEAGVMLKLLSQLEAAAEMTVPTRSLPGGTKALVS